MSVPRPQKRRIVGRERYRSTPNQESYIFNFEDIGPQLANILLKNSFFVCKTANALEQFRLSTQCIGSSRKEFFIFEVRLEVCFNEFEVILKKSTCVSGAAYYYYYKV